jgi:adenylosuccinate synthase
MPSTIVVGGQYGSEGKGKVTALTASLLDDPWVVRCGGPNSGHTTNINGKEHVLRQLPAAVGHPNALLLLSAGCAISEDVLLDELNRFDIAPERVVVDPRAVLVTQEDQEAEQILAEDIGSTASGTGAALARRMLRRNDVQLATNSQRLCGRVRIESVVPLLHDHLDRNGHVIVEGTQGFGLSLLHGPDYPYVTARDTTASGFAMEVGLSPRQITDIIMVVRTFPIRVGGNSGELANEISWDEVQRLSGASEPALEYTSVTHRLRRVGTFDFGIVKAAAQVNRPTALAVMGCDRLDYSNYALRRLDQLSAVALNFIRRAQDETGVPVTWAGTGFGTYDVVALGQMQLVGR